MNLICRPGDSSSRPSGHPPPAPPLTSFSQPLALSCLCCWSFYGWRAQPPPASAERSTPGAPGAREPGARRPAWGSSGQFWGRSSSNSSTRITTPTLLIGGGVLNTGSAQGHLWLRLPLPSYARGLPASSTRTSAPPEEGGRKKYALISRAFAHHRAPPQPPVSALSLPHCLPQLRAPPLQQRGTTPTAEPRNGRPFRELEKSCEPSLQKSARAPINIASRGQRILLLLKAPGTQLKDTVSASTLSQSSLVIACVAACLLMRLLPSGTPLLPQSHLSACGISASP
ncbi:uncharacterized protein LOC102160414 [Sus scrofa]|uniref:uncharacterized protein LOC102160414 n=1 Tax=Sus scrofa TaxID=9823 RepID=UPI000A2B7509|nr:uncharacterized protein LOC102160414 [Sus scrofa]